MAQIKMDPNTLVPLSEDQVTGLKKLCLKYHNEKRALHKVGPLGYNDTLARTAQEWANILMNKNAFDHRPDCPYGENLYVRAGTNPMPDEIAIPSAVDSWYAEIKDYKLYGTEPTVKQLMSGAPTGHFTQLIWKDTVTVGMGIARGPQNKVVVCCNYAPAGNIVNQFNKNVLPAAKK